MIVYDSDIKHVYIINISSTIIPHPKVVKGPKKCDGIRMYR